MTPEEVDRLLFKSESETLDFKENQYAFSGASVDQKSELLKDILGFCNAWRSEPAYILIGVREQPGGKAAVVGCKDHIQDHCLQQFVASKTNRPVMIGYSVVAHSEGEVGVITIDVQTRPIFLKSNFGKLKKNEVYVRRGSSTDPVTPANPDEIREMGRDVSKAAIEVRIHDPIQCKEHGSELRITKKYCEFPPKAELPDFTSWPVCENPHVRKYTRVLLDKDYYRKCAVAFHHMMNFVPMQLSVKNTGRVVADDVEIEIHIERQEGVECLSEDGIVKDLPLPSRRITDVALDLRHIGHVSVGDGSICIDGAPSRLSITTAWGRIQPGRSMLSDRIYVAAKPPSRTFLETTVYAANLPYPHHCSLSIVWGGTIESYNGSMFVKYVDSSLRNQRDC